MPTPASTTIAPDIGPRAERHIDATFRALLGGAGTHVEPAFAQVVTGSAHPFGNFVLLADPNDAEAARRAIEPLRDPALFACAIAPGPAFGAAVTAVLDDAGFPIADAMPAMAVAIDRLAPTALPEGHVLERLEPGESEPEWTEALAVGYEIPLVAAETFRPTRAIEASGAVQRWAVRERGAIVATALLHLCDDLAGVYCVATRPEARRRGLGAHATAEPLRRLGAKGPRLAVLQASHAGHPVYAKLGFADVGAIAMRLRLPGS